MKVEHPTPRHVAHPVAQPLQGIASRLRVGELTEVGVALTAEEMKAVAGAAMGVSWQCGRPKRDDEWV